MNILHCFGKSCLNLFLPALAGRRFRLAGQGLAFPLAKWVSEVRVVFDSGGGPNGMVVAGYVGDRRPCWKPRQPR